MWHFMYNVHNYTQLCVIWCLHVRKQWKTLFFLFSGPPIHVISTTEKDGFRSKTLENSVFHCFRSRMLNNLHKYADLTWNVNMWSHIHEMLHISYISCIMCHNLHKYIQLYVFMCKCSHYVNNVSWITHLCVVINIITNKCE